MTRSGYLFPSGMLVVPPKIAPQLSRVLSAHVADLARRQRIEVPEAFAAWLADLADFAAGIDAPDELHQSAPSVWVSTEVAAEQIGVSARRVRMMVEKRQLRSRRDGRRWLVAAEDVELEVEARQAVSELIGTVPESAAEPSRHSGTHHDRRPRKAAS